MPTSQQPSPGPLTPDRLPQVISAALADTPLLDLHTHIYSADFGELLLWGAEELVTYHYLIAEVCRAPGGPTPAEFFAMTRRQQADRIWQELFVKASPISEACRGVTTTLTALGIDVNQGSLKPAREYFADVTVDQHIRKVLELANVSQVVMTNDPFDPLERPVWLGAGCTDDRFIPALRLDGLLIFWHKNWPTLRSWGYDATGSLTPAALAGTRRFLLDEIKRMNPAYMAVSLPDTFTYPSTARGTGVSPVNAVTSDPTAQLITHAVLPVARQTGVPFAMMIGVKRQLNPALKLAGDGVGKADIRAVEHLCADNPDVKFLVTMLSLENQHELCVAARKLPNLMPFGCWWFLNDPSLIEEITRMRLELLGLSMIPQHSDARILDQLIYKWKHSKAILAKVLTDKYTDLTAAGWTLSEQQVRADVKRLLSDNFAQFIKEG